MSDIKLADHNDVSVLNFRPFLDGSNKQEVADALFASMKNSGFVYLVNHGMPQDKIDEMFAMSKRFFALPMETKELAPHPPTGTHHRGYSAPGVEKVSQHLYDSSEISELRSKAPDVKESFECGREESKEMPNIWIPENIANDVLPGFKDTCLDFFWTFHKTELMILKALALGLHLPEDFFLQYHTEPENQLRLLHYPSVSIEALQNDTIARIGAHSDFGSITLLLQDDAGGLEIEDPNKPGHFRPAPPVPGSLIVNAGDLLMRWSNDIIRSAVHRVRVPQNLSTRDGMILDRYSIPYFCSADLSAIVDCIPGTWSDERPKRYEPISAGEYIIKRLSASY